MHGQATKLIEAEDNLSQEMAHTIPKISGAALARSADFGHWNERYKELDERLSFMDEWLPQSSWDDAAATTRGIQELTNGQYA